MILRIILYIIGILIISTSLSYMYLYTNLFTMGYSFKEYLLYILKRWECIMFLLGILIIVICFKKGKTNAKYFFSNFIIF